MSSENCEDLTVSVSLPRDVGNWIDEEADRRAEPREQFCRRLLAGAYTVATDDTEIVPDEQALETVQSDLETVRSAVDDELADQREEFQDLLEDVRSRVVQVKRETDTKAPVEHDHDEYVMEDTVDSLRAELAELDASLQALERSTRDGFDNFEEILDHLLEETTELGERSTALAQATLSLQKNYHESTAREQTRAEAESLQRAANRLGIRSAVCEECGSNVDIALLSKPTCPHCSSSFADIVSKSSIFGSHTLQTGDPPALEGAIESIDEPSEQATATNAFVTDGSGDPSPPTPGDGEDDG